MDFLIYIYISKRFSIVNATNSKQLNYNCQCSLIIDSHFRFKWLHFAFRDYRHSTVNIKEVIFLLRGASYCCHTCKPNGPSKPGNKKTCADANR